MPAGAEGLLFLPYLTGERLAEHTNSRAQFLACSASIAAVIYSAQFWKGWPCIPAQSSAAAEVRAVSATNDRFRRRRAQLAVA